MRLSVIIPAYNAAGSLAGCLDSVTGSGAEVTVVDDGTSVIWCTPCQIDFVPPAVLS